MSTPTFIVGTGRCGSTMLSNMLREHPKVLSLSEFFSIVTNAGRAPGSFGAELVDGSAFWSMLASSPARNTFALRHRVAPPEIIYPCDDPNSRFCRANGVPAILLVTLPHLTEEPDRLFDVLREEVSSWPPASPGEQYRRLFGWLAERFGKLLWVERSGYSLYLAPLLLATFPDARFVHVTRDLRDAALSIQQHSGFRIGIILHLLEQTLGVDPLASADRTQVARVPGHLRPFLPEQFDAEAFEAFRIPLPHIVDFSLVAQIGIGLPSFASLPADRILHVRYEDLLAAPRQQLDSLASFLGEEFVDDGWAARCASAVRKPRSSWRNLPADEARTLTEACRPGFEKLAAAGVHYDL